jgi:hypothetical protein
MGGTEVGEGASVSVFRKPHFVRTRDRPDRPTNFKKSRRPLKSEKDELRSDFIQCLNVIKLVKRLVGHSETFALDGFVPWILAAWADRFDRMKHDVLQARQDIRSHRAAEQQHDGILHP